MKIRYIGCYLCPDVQSMDRFLSYISRCENISSRVLGAGELFIRKTNARFANEVLMNKVNDSAPDHSSRQSVCTEILRSLGDLYNAPPRRDLKDGPSPTPTHLHFHVTGLHDGRGHLFSVPPGLGIIHPKIPCNLKSAIKISRGTHPLSVRAHGDPQPVESREKLGGVNCEPPTTANTLH
ncbi:hypothetical protein J6590_020574 [Homalodisca vitripennis]|nr:hypothetical protein J6590_020574 [Homalodisca vitripennis]